MTDFIVDLELNSRPYILERLFSIQKNNVTTHDIENPHSPILFDLKGNGNENTFTHNNVIIKNINTYNSQLNSLFINFKIK